MVNDPDIVARVAYCQNCQKKSPRVACNGSADADRQLHGLGWRRVNQYAWRCPWCRSPQQREQRKYE